MEFSSKLTDVTLMTHAIVFPKINSNEIFLFSSQAIGSNGK